MVKEVATTDTGLRLPSLKIESTSNMKTIDTLVDDIYEVIRGAGGWTGTNGAMLGKSVALTANQRFSKPQEPRGYLSLSSIGTPCKRKLWYKVNKAGEGEKLTPNTLLKFFYGDMIEELILSMAIAAGHSAVAMPLRSLRMEHYVMMIPLVISPSLALMSMLQRMILWLQIKLMVPSLLWINRMDISVWMSMTSLKS